MFFGDVKSVQEHGELSIWMGQLVAADPPHDPSVGLDHHEGGFWAAEKGSAVEVASDAETPAGRLGDRLVAGLEASHWNRGHERSLAEMRGSGGDAAAKHSEYAWPFLRDGYNWFPASRAGVPNDGRYQQSAKKGPVRNAFLSA